MLLDFDELDDTDELSSFLSKRYQSTNYNFFYLKHLKNRKLLSILRPSEPSLTSCLFGLPVTRSAGMVSIYCFFFLLFVEHMQTSLFRRSCRYTLLAKQMDCKYVHIYVCMYVCMYVSMTI